MLVLSRKKGESIMIGDNIEVTVAQVYYDNKVRLGITAPKNISVHRKEIWDIIHRQRSILEREKGGTGKKKQISMRQKM